MLEFLFYFHLFAFSNFLFLYIYNYRNLFVKTFRNTGLIKIKMSLILFGWSLLGILGAVIFFPRNTSAELQGQLCGMYWLTALVMFPLLEIGFLTVGVVFTYVIKIMNHSDEPVSIFNSR